MQVLLSATAPVDLNTLALSPKDILIRMLCAMIVGTVIGMEREYTHRPAGLRTHILVALGACAVMITGQLIFFQYRPLGGTSDPARLAAQVISGVGFLGAGTIMREGVNVKGLTTAASLWAVACLGIAAGGGYYQIALVGMVLMFITLTLLEVLQNLLLKGTKKHNKDYAVHTSNVSDAINAINHAAELCLCRISNISIQEESNSFCIYIHTEFGTGGRKRRQQRFIDLLTSDVSITSINFATEPVTTK